MAGIDRLRTIATKASRRRMVTKLDWFFTHGLVGGLTVQFAEGRWREEIGDGIALNWDAFKVIEPMLASSCAEWTSLHAFGPLELSPTCLQLMVGSLRKRKAEGRTMSSPEKELLTVLANWLVERLDARKVVSFLGI